MAIKYFEEIDTNNLGNYYSKVIEVESALINIDLNFDTNTLTAEQLQKLNACLNTIKNITDNSWQWILQDYKNGVDVKEFIKFHLEEFFEEDIKELLEGTNANLSTDERFLQTLRINRIGIYPSSPEHYLIIDWMINPDLSNYVLVVVVNENLKLGHITVES